PCGLCYQLVGVAVAVGGVLLDGEDDGDEGGLEDGDELAGAELDGGRVGFLDECGAEDFLGLAEAVGDCVTRVGLACDGVGAPGPLLTAVGAPDVVAFWSEV